MVDLHIHTTYSDGLRSLREVLLLAQNMGLSTISITDHNTTKAYEELDNNNNYDLIFKGNIIKGIEINANYKGHKIELLAYDFDNYMLIDKLVKRDSYKTNKKMHDFIEKERLFLIDKFEELNLVVDPLYKEDVFIDFFESRLYNSILENNDKDYVKNRLKDNYYDTGYQFYRKCVTSPETPFYIDYSRLDMKIGEVCDIIHKNNGLVFLAHPLLYGIKDIRNVLNSLYDEFPIDGIECYYNGFSIEQIRFLKDFANNRKLLISGGSDYHGKDGYKGQIGYCAYGSMFIDDSIIHNWNLMGKNKILCRNKSV